jgi:rRNA maturation endonuclease Nob1
MALYECLGCRLVSGEPAGQCKLCGHGEKKPAAPLRGRRKPRPVKKKNPGP